MHHYHTTTSHRITTTTTTSHHTTTTTTSYHTTTTTTSYRTTTTSLLNTTTSTTSYRPPRHVPHHHLAPQHRHLHYLISTRGMYCTTSTSLLNTATSTTSYRPEACNTPPPPPRTAPPPPQLPHINQWRNKRWRTGGITAEKVLVEENISIAPPPCTMKNTGSIKQAQASFSGTKDTLNEEETLMPLESQADVGSVKQANISVTSENTRSIKKTSTSVSENKETFNEEESSMRSQMATESSKQTHVFASGSKDTLNEEETLLSLGSQGAVESMKQTNNSAEEEALQPLGSQLQDMALSSKKSEKYIEHTESSEIPEFPFKQKPISAHWKLSDQNKYFIEVLADGANIEQKSESTGLMVSKPSGSSSKLLDSSESPEDIAKAMIISHFNIPERLFKKSSKEQDIRATYEKYEIIENIWNNHQPDLSAIGAASKSKVDKKQIISLLIAPSTYYSYASNVFPLLHYYPEMMSWMKWEEDIDTNKVWKSKKANFVNLLSILEGKRDAIENESQRREVESEEDPERKGKQREDKGNKGKSKDDKEGKEKSKRSHRKDKGKSKQL
ncbi:hypothetical protein BDQ17DRAFT_1431767 [Cyathus striatus]|nr:hypothetical protein BDQ17DRAFT_1431767 [Cyathus striatus]